MVYWIHADRQLCQPLGKVYELHRELLRQSSEEMRAMLDWKAF